MPDFTTVTDVLESVQDQAGVASAENEALISIEVEAGKKLEIYEIIASFYGAGLAGRLIVFNSTTAAILGTNIYLGDVMFETAKAEGPLGVAGGKTLKREDGKPLFTIDNKGGSVSAFFNLEIAEFVSDATQAIVGNAVTQVYSAVVKGKLYSTLTGLYGSY